METISQGFTLLEGFMLGILSGVVYDVFRVLRARLKMPLLGHVLDLMFWFLVTAVIFVWSQGAWDGRIRLYGVFSLTLGAIFYFMTFTAITLWIGFRFADFTQFLFKVLYLPVTVLIALEKKIKKNAKNLFLFWLKWYRIETMTKSSTSTRQTQEKGGVAIAHQTGRDMDQNRRHRSSNLSGGNSTHRPRSNSRSPSSRQRITNKSR